MSNRVRLIGWCTFLVMLSLIPLFITSGRWIDFLEMTMFVAVLGQGWNILGGYVDNTHLAMLYFLVQEPTFKPYYSSNLV